MRNEAAGYQKYSEDGGEQHAVAMVGRRALKH